MCKCLMKFYALEKGGVPLQTMSGIYQELLRMETFSL